MGPGAGGLPTLWLPSRGQCRWDQVQVQRLHLEGQARRALWVILTARTDENSKIVIGWLPFQPSGIEKVPWCFYPDDYGYTVTASNETSGGMTAHIIRNKKYRSSGRPNSPDIDMLRVSIHYHSSHMLQFKVCALLQLWSLPCIHFLLIETFTPHVDLGSGHRSLWGSSATVSTCNSRDWWEQEAL